MNKVYDGIMGLVVGDALGVPVEFHQRDTFTVTDMIGYGTYNQPPGTWSDDSSLTLATLESLVRMKKIDLEDIMRNFMRWLFGAEFTPWGEVFDVGAGTHRAIVNYRTGNDVRTCGGKLEMDNGNGSLMRILPLAFIPHTVEDIFNVSALTHAHKVSQIACAVYITAAKALIDGCSKKRTFELACGFPEYWNIEFSRLKDLPNLPRHEIKSSGYVIHTLEAAFWCFLTTDSYLDCVLAAVNLGEDTDTTAAVAGGLAGIYYGIGGSTGIPESWTSQIPSGDWIKDLCSELIIEN